MKRTIFRVLAVALGCLAFPGMLFGKSSSSVTLSSSLNPSTYGSSVTLTAMVTPLVATGTITFKDESTTLGTGTISGGLATFSSSKLAQGSHYLTASYGGSAKYNGSTSLLLIQVVNKANTTVTLASSANPSAYGASVKFTATVTPTTATGTVTFMDGSTTLGTGTISAGKATFSISTLAAGSNSITASYGGDTNDNSSTSSVLTQTVNKTNTTVTLASSANPSAYGASVTFTATVTPTTATGTVTFTDGSTTLGAATISAGKATFSISTLAVGSNSITASYGGDTNDNGSTLTTMAQTVNKTNTTITLASSANPSTYGSSVTFTATVTPTTATGTVTFTDGSATLGTATISNGSATYSTSTLAGGSQSIKASYGGDTNDNSSTLTTLTQTVNKRNTTVTLASSANPSTYGSSVTFTATVTPTTATGTVTFTDGSTTLGTATISNGSATYSTSTLASGSQSIAASYGGDTNDNSSTSSVLTQTVNKKNTTVMLASSANPSTYGASVTFTATVTPATATGTVTFTDGSATLGTATISNGSATYSTSTLASGAQSITASYGGDTNDNSSTLTTLTQTVNKRNTTVMLASSANPSTYGSSVTFTATVTPTTATGTVTFTDGSTTLGTATISNGSATYSTSTLASGSQSIAASYGGDTNDNSSTLTTLTQTVNKRNTTVMLASSANPSTYGASVTFTATVTPTTATGTVTFTDGSTTLGTATISNGSATYSTSTLAVGSNSITASYGGDTNDNGTTSSVLTQTINSAPQVVTTSLPAGTAGTSYSATLAATGGTTPYRWSISSGSLPAELSLNANTGAITGTPTVAGTSNFTVQATDANNLTATQPLSIVVAGVITAVSPVFGPVGTNVTIGGLGFGTTPGTVAFGGAAATTITSWGATSIVAAVPTGAGTGNVVVTVGGVSSNGVTFTTTTGITQANLNTSRYQHSATTLNNWQILVVGGLNCPTSGSCTYLNSAELYNPGSSAFTNTGTMATARSAPAVLLSTGKVFVAGGYTCDGSGNCSSLTSAEIYDPTAGTFSSAGTMTVPRNGHTMTVLGNGTVLIAGGENCTSAKSCSALSSAEIYDPTAGTFTPTSNGMSAPRFDASAVLLNSGSVLIAGGFDGTNLPAAAEIYSPASGGFTGSGPSLNVPRFDASATLLNNGKVLVAGGSTCSLPGCPTNAAEVYDPVANTFSMVTGGMIVPRFNHTATLLTTGDVVVAGGYSSCGSSCNAEASTELFDPVAGTFTSGPPMATGLAGHTGTLVANGNVLLIGGINAGVTVASDELYQPTSLTPPGLVSITVAPAISSLMPGQSEPLVATGTFNDSSTQTLQSVIWSSSNPSVATISNSAGSAGIVNALAAGTTTLTATGGNVSGSASLNVIILASTTVTLTSSANPSAYGSPVTFTATVTPTTATGTVTFTDGSTTLGTGTISSGTATYSTSALAVGSQSITASYGGDTNDSSSTTTLTQTVTKTSTTVTLASSANPSAYGSPVTFTATVTPATATGTVTFTDGSTTLGTGTISGGTATYSTSALAVGSNSITASYSGDTNDSSGTSSALTQTISSTPQVITTSLSAGMVETSYSATLAASGGTTPYSWSISSGSLPEGLSLNASTGAITGIPTVESTSNFTVDVTDANNISATQPLSIVVTPILTYSARTDNCVNGTQSGCISGKTTGEAGAALLFQEGVSDPIPTGFTPTTISSGSCPSGWTPSSYPAYCPSPTNSTATDPDFGSYLVMVTDDNTNAHNSAAPYTAAWNVGSDGNWDAFSWDETLYLAKNSGGGATIFNLNPSAIHAQTCATAPGCVNSSGIYTALSGAGDSTHLAHGGSWSFSRVTSEPNVLYEMSSVPTQVNQLVITSSITSPGTGSLSRSVYVDFTSDTPAPCSVMESAAPGNPTTYAASWTGSFQVADDGTVSYGMTGGYNWAASWAVTPIDTFILPTAGNAGKYGFQATAISGTGITGTSEPTWCQTAGCTVTDGGVIWTNIDKLDEQSQGFDMVIYRPAGTSAPGCTRINTRLGKIYRGTGNSAPAGYMTTNDELVCTRAGTWPTVPCTLPDRFTLHEVEQGENGQYVEFSPTGGEAANPPGSWNSGTLSCQASNTSWQGAYSTANTYVAKNIVSYAGLYYTALTTVPSGSGHAPSGTTSSNTYWSNTESYCNSYFFDTTSTLVAPLTDWVHGSGHSAAGYLHKYYGSYYRSMLYSLPVIDGVLNPDTPMLLAALPCDDHGTYQNSGTSDLTPIFTATTDVPAWPTRYDVANGACYDEICAFNSDGSGLTYRFGHTYNTGSSSYFSIQNNIGVNSPLGDLIAFGTDMMGVRGSNAAANTACNNLRGQYQPAPSGTVTYQDYVYPITENSDNNIFQATGCGTDTTGATCTEGKSLPNWDSACGTLNSTCTDGGVTWTNKGPNTCRGDVVILDALSAHATP